MNTHVDKETHDPLYAPAAPALELFKLESAFLQQKAFCPRKDIEVQIEQKETTIFEDNWFVTL